MPLFACPFRIQRLTLQAAELTPITPPITCSSVTIANRTGGDVRIITDGSGTEYGILTTDFEERIDLSQSGAATALFHTGQVNFHLQADMTGVVVLSWT